MIIRKDTELELKQKVFKTCPMPMMACPDPLAPLYQKISFYEVVALSDDSLVLTFV